MHAVRVGIFSILIFVLTRPDQRRDIFKQHLLTYLKITLLHIFIQILYHLPSLLSFNTDLGLRPIFTVHFLSPQIRFVDLRY